MLEPLGLVVHGVPWISQHAGEKRLDHAMPAQRAERDALPGLRQTDAPLGLVLEQSLIRKAPHHSRD
jgi:hypothetical protein